MSNSPLVDYVKISPNSTNPRNSKITAITIHHMAGNLSVESCGEIFAARERQASSNYGIGSDGRVGLYVDEANRSWCSSNRDNDNRAVTIEVANDTVGSDWHISDAALAKLIDLCVDICQRNGIPRLNFTGDKSGNLTMHKWFAPTLCPGPYLESRFPYIAVEVNKRLDVTDTVSTEPVTSGTQASAFQDMTSEQVIAKVGPLFTADQQKSGILASVSLAQFILESGYGKSELAVQANNCFGMKRSLSGNTWSGSTWDGVSVLTIQTREQNADGSYTTINADFRRYADVEASIADHSAYLLGAMNGSKKRYEGIAELTDYKAAAQLLKDGGYATDLNYVTKLCSIIEKWELTRYDVTVETVAPELKKGCYRVRKSWADAKSQVGAYRIYANAKKAADSHPGYAVYDPDGKEVYTSAEKQEDTPQTDCPFLVKVSIPDLNIRCGAGTNYARTGNFTGIGVFTIMEVKNGAGSNAGWGRLKSGAGWISLDYAKRL